MNALAAGALEIIGKVGWMKILLIIALAGSLAWGKRVDHLRAGYREQSLSITDAVGKAAGIKNLKPDKAAAAALRLGVDLSQCRSNNQTLEAGIGRQNDAVDRAHKDSSARVSRVEHRLTLADGERDEAVRRANQLLHGRTATAGDKIAACEAADKLILETIR